ncbi:MAG: hypothetical protein IJK61_03155 [Bacteroidetes bacterium]|nr:hypothetical protein [Bacteroidota bacterium]
MKNIFFVFIFSCLFIGILSTSCLAKTKYDKNTIFTKIKKTYSNLDNIQIEFTDNQKSSIYYILTASKGNKYSLVGKDRQIYCDGKTVWNYNIKEKNVLISDFDEDMTNFTIDYFFFKIIPNLTPTSLTTKNKTYILDLKSKTDYDEIKTVKLVITKDLKKINSIEINSNMGWFTWYIKSINTNLKLKSNSYYFTIPKNVEIIDCR